MINYYLAHKHLVDKKIIIYYKPFSARTGRIQQIDPEIGISIINANDPFQYLFCWRSSFTMHRKYPTE